MFKKLLLAVVAFLALPFLSRSFREGYKKGWNDEHDRQTKLGNQFMKYVPKFR
jgi:hypothetical protein